MESSMKAWPSPHPMKTAVSAIFVGMWQFHLFRESYSQHNNDRFYDQGGRGE
jgi:hypothetical protein